MLCVATFKSQELTSNLRKVYWKHSKFGVFSKTFCMLNQLEYQGNRGNLQLSAKQVQNYEFRVRGVTHNLVTGRVSMLSLVYGGLVVVYRLRRVHGQHTVLFVSQLVPSYAGLSWKSKCEDPAAKQATFCFSKTITGKKELALIFS